MSAFVPLGAELRFGQHTCGREMVSGQCGAPATWCIRWTPEGDVSACCDEHMAEVLRNWVFVGRHPIGPDCTMPGAWWYPDRCAVPTDDVAAAEAAMSEALR